jgi:hypothetical protein
MRLFRALKFCKLNVRALLKPVATGKSTAGARRKLQPDTIVEIIAENHRGIS